jgi:Na+/proline symporter
VNAVLFAVLAYVLVQFAIGVYVSRRIRTEADYLVAGRSLGYGVATFTIFATWFGAETCIGAAGAIYENGLSGGSSDPFGYGVTLLFMAAVFAVPLWRRKLTTLADLFRLRYSRGVERLAVVLMVPASVLWAAAQVRAFGQVLAASAGLEVAWMISLAAFLVIAYTVFGGLLADAWTDLVQGVALMVGLVILAVGVLRGAGTEPFRQIEPERLQLFGGEDVTLLATLEDWAVPVLGSVIAAELVVRVIATRSPQIARRSALTAGGVYLAFGLIPAGIGLVGFDLLPGLEDPEQILPLIAQQYLPTLLYALFAGALVSAMLSTVDSTLLVASSLVSHNVIVPLRQGLSEREKVRIARVGVAVFGVIAYALALSAEGVYALVAEASAFGSAGIFMVVAFGLFTRWGGRRTAAATLVVGMAAWIIGAHLLDLSYPYLTSLAAAGLTYVATATVERDSGAAVGIEPAPLSTHSRRS